MCVCERTRVFVCVCVYWLGWGTIAYAARSSVELEWYCFEKGRDAIPFWCWWSVYIFHWLPCQVIFTVGESGLDCCFPCYVCVLSTPVLPQWHVKDSGHSAKSAGGRLHLNTHTPLTQQSRNGLTMPLCRHSMGTYPETSSRATCQETFGHSRLSPLISCGLILAERVELVCAI